MRDDPVIRSLTAQSFEIPTDALEADGTLWWNKTVLVVVEIEAGGMTGLGYTYCSGACTEIVDSVLAGVLRAQSAFAIPELHAAMMAAVRNLGSRGVCACAVSAVDVALWDLKARLLDLPLVALLGEARQAVPIYGSGGFTSYTNARLCRQLASWVDELGCRWVKMKVGSNPEEDPARVRAARTAIGDAGLFVDANGAYARKQALRLAEIFADCGVSWFEEPVSSDDLAGLRLLRDRSPAGMDIAAGEYGFEPFYFRRMLAAGAVDVLQADATRCGGYTGFLKAATLADAWGMPLSAHTAPALHLPVCCAAPRVRNLEWFHDHVRIEQALFDGAPAAAGGEIRPSRDRPGHGLIFRRQDVERLVA